MCAVASVSRETEAGGSSEPVSRETPPVPRRNPVSRALVFLLLLPLRAYSRWISPALPPRCRYYPSCSTYAEQAVRELGPFKGTIVAVWRVLRCNPWSAGGLDPLDSRRLFRSDTSNEVPTGPHEHPR
jgi:uncharacterized protein